MKKPDTLLYSSLIILAVLGLSVLGSLSAQDSPPFLSFKKQLFFFALALVVFFVFSRIDWRIFYSSSVLWLLYGITIVLLGLVLVIGTKSHGTSAWFRFGMFSFQPVEFAKIVLLLVLAKYLSARHLEIWQFPRLVTSGLFAFLPMGLLALQPDLGGAIVLGLIWFGLVIVSRIRMKQIVLLLILFIVLVTLSWSFFLKPYQKARILNFLNPQADPLGIGYNREQSLIAIGSGELFGKGLGWGTQTHLHFLPLAKTDFIFAALGEELGFVGIVLLLSCYLILISRLVHWALILPYNFCKLFTIGFAIKIMVEVFINAGMNLGLVPIIGIALPFMSLGGSHLLADFMGLGIINSMIRNS